MACTEEERAGNSFQALQQRKHRPAIRCGRNSVHAVRAYQQDEKATFASDHRVEDSVLPTFYGEQRVKVIPW